MRIDHFINFSNINNRSKLSSDVVKWAIIGAIINIANNPCGSRNAFRKTNLDTVRIELEGETAVLGDSWKANFIQELLSIGRTSYYLESDSETEYEDEADFCSLSAVLPQNFIINKIKDRNNSLPSREYLKLVFSHENIARKLLIKRASQFWWLNKSETIAEDGQYSFYFNLKRYTNNKIFKIRDDNFIILECLKNNLSISYILQYSLEEQSKLFGWMNISSSISPEVFNRWILTISPYIKKFNQLTKFTCHLKGLKKIPYTLRSYAKGLECILEPIINKMGLIENRIKNGVNHDTLLSFEEEMNMYFHIISYVYSVHSKAIDSNWESTDNWKTSIKLISVLFWSIQTAIIDYQKLIVVTLFLYAFEPYVHMTELWIHAGQLVDENNEFIINNYEGDSSIAFNILFKDLHGYLKDCNLCVPPILEYLIHFLNNCDWKVFVASEISNDAIALCEVPRGELFNSFLIEIKNSNTFWENYINPLNEYNPSNWNKLPLLATTCVHYNSQFNLSNVSC
uniref:Gamma tubulin complex component protein N-terminal domain-containing protein n=1 Tax=Schizaphis graminum TaxID=13262 RepID=A0A2S2NLL2_SCHGA